MIVANVLPACDNGEPQRSGAAVLIHPAPGTERSISMQRQSTGRDPVHLLLEVRPTVDWRGRLIARREIAADTGCWEWGGPRLPKGYGRIFGTKQFAGGRNVYVHRLAAAVFLGESVEGALVCHRCDNPPCFNPDHLFVGTASDNSQDMSAKGRAGRAGSTLTDDDIRAIYMRALGGESRPSIAADYGIEKERVSRIAHGQRFGWLTRDLPKPPGGRFGAKGGRPKRTPVIDRDAA